MKLEDLNIGKYLDTLDFNDGVIFVLDHEQVLKIQIQKVYMNNTEYIKRFAKLLKKNKFIRKYSTIFPKENDFEIDDKMLNLRIMFQLAQLKDIENIDFEIL